MPMRWGAIGNQLDRASLDRYYGCFYRRELIQTLEHINQYLMRWAMRKYKRLHDRSPVSREAHAGICERRRAKLPPATQPR